MSDRDTITLPRELVFRAVKALTPMAYDTWPRERQEIVTALRKALAAEPTKHPGYVIGSHWLETAYSRICAGESEARVLRDYGSISVGEAEALQRENEALRRDAERYRWLRGEHSRIDPCIKANAKYRLERDSSTWVNIHDLDAAIDAAMREDKT